MLIARAPGPLAKTIHLILRHGSYVGRSEGTVKGAKAALADWQPHLVLLDIDLEADEGIQLFDEARAGGRIGVIVLTRRSDLRGKLAAFDRGFDDFMGLPFVPDDLIARMRAVLFKTRGNAGELVPRLRIGEIEIDVLARTVLVEGQVLHMSSLEQALLYLLAGNAGSVLSREQILDALWGTDFICDGSIVEWHVRSLRAKLEDGPHAPGLVETVPGMGYRFVGSAVG